MTINRRLEEIRPVITGMLIASLLLGGCKPTPTPNQNATPVSVTPEVKVELDHLQFNYDKDKLRGDLEETAKLLKSKDQKASDEISRQIGPESERWKQLAGRLAALDAHRKSLTENIAKLLVPEEEIKNLKSTIDGIQGRPNAPQLLRDRAEEAGKALDAYKIAWTNVTKATADFAKPIEAATSQWEAIQKDYKDLADKKELKPEDQQKFTDEATKKLGDADKLGLSADGTIRSDGPLNLLMRGYAEFEKARNTFWEKYKELRNTPGLLDKEKKDLDTNGGALQAKDSDFVKVSKVVLTSAVETLNTIALLSALGVSLGPWGIVAIAALILLKNILGGFDGTPGGTGDGKVPGGSEKDGKDGDKGGEEGSGKDGSDKNIVVEDPNPDTHPVQGSNNGEFGFRFNTDKATGHLLVYIEKESDRDQRYELIVVSKDTTNEDLKAVRDTYPTGKLAFESFSPGSGKTATADFRAMKAGKRGLVRVEWKLTPGATPKQFKSTSEPTARFTTLTKEE